MLGTNQEGFPESRWVVLDKGGKVHELQRFFDLPQREAAKLLGMSETSLKYTCRKFGIRRWPWRALSKEKQSTLVRTDSPVLHCTCSNALKK
jgi:hypothetical protein